MLPECGGRWRRDGSASRAGAISLLGRTWAGEWDSILPNATSARGKTPDMHHGRVLRYWHRDKPENEQGVPLSSTSGSRIVVLGPASSGPSTSSSGLSTSSSGLTRGCLSTSSSGLTRGSADARNASIRAYCRDG